MSLMDVDVVLTLPPGPRAATLRTSAALAGRMLLRRAPSAFQLGRPLASHPGAGPCEPHVSVFMLRVAPAEVDALLDAVARVAGRTPPLPAVGEVYRHNPQGAPELFLRRTPAWFALQRAVVAAVEPLRRGRVREHDPAGDHIGETINRLRRDGSDRARLRQLTAYGYDEITDDVDDRFNPHVTLAWPADRRTAPPLGGLPEPGSFRETLTDLAVYTMGSHGTCLTRLGGHPLRSGAVLVEGGVR